MEKIKLPKDWKIVISSEIMDIRDGTHDTPKYVNENGIPLITSKNLKGNEIDFNKVSYISNEDHFEISKRSKVESGDILFAMIGTIGNPAIIKGDANFSIKNVGLFKKNESVILPQFFVNFLRSSLFEKQLNERKLLKGTTQRFIPLGNLRKIEIPLPEIETQQAIVSKIDELFSELDKGIEDLKTAQQQLKTYRQSVLKWAFEGKLTNENVKGGKLPKGWEWSNVKEITTLLGDGLHGTPKYDSNGEYYFINGNNLNDGKIEIKENTKKVSKEEFEKYKKQLNDKTIFVSINGSLGYTAFYNNEPVILGKSACYFNVKDGIDKHYIRYIFTSQRFTNYSVTVATGSTIKNVSLKSMREFEIPLPKNIEEQCQIVQEIESRLSVADKMEESIAHSLLQAESLRQSILKKAFNGELV